MKDKHAALVRRLQNIAIAALTVSALFLLTQTPLVGELSGKTPYELARSFFSDTAPEETVTTAEASELALPVRVVFTSEYARFGLDAITTLDASFEQAGVFFSEALGTAEAPVPCAESALLAALEKSGLYLDLEADTPLTLLAAVLGVTAPDDSLTQISRLLLSPEDDGSVTLYLYDSARGCFSCRTAVSSATLTAALAALDGNGTDFAFALTDDYAALSPYTLVFSEPSTRFQLSTASGITDQAELLRQAEFNAHASGYTDSAGTTVLQESYGTLRLSPDGTVAYQGDSAAPGSLYYVSAADSGRPTLSEAISAAQKLAFTLLRDRCGDAQLYFSSAEVDGHSYTVTFDYVVDGTPLHFSDGSHAASVTIEGQTITAFTLHCRSYTLTDQPALLLPAPQAAAIAAANYPAAELRVCYDARGTESVGVSWFAR